VLVDFAVFNVANSICGDWRGACGTQIRHDSPDAWVLPVVLMVLLNPGCPTFEAAGGGELRSWNRRRIGFQLVLTVGDGIERSSIVFSQVRLLVCSLFFASGFFGKQRKEDEEGR